MELITILTVIPASFGLAFALQRGTLQLIVWALGRSAGRALEPARTAKVIPIRGPRVFASPEAA